MDMDVEGVALGSVMVVVGSSGARLCRDRTWMISFSLRGWGLEKVEPPRRAMGVERAALLLRMETEILSLTGSALWLGVGWAMAAKKQGSWLVTVLVEMMLAT